MFSYVLFSLRQQLYNNVQSYGYTVLDVAVEFSALCYTKKVWFIPFLSGQMQKKIQKQESRSGNICFVITSGICGLGKTFKPLMCKNYPVMVQRKFRQNSGCWHDHQQFWYWLITFVTTTIQYLHQCASPINIWLPGEVLILQDQLWHEHAVGPNSYLDKIFFYWTEVCIFLLTLE